MIERVVDGLFAFCDMLGITSDGAHTIDRGGVRAAVVPAAPERALVNSVVYRDPEALESVYDELADAYRAIDAGWTVWVWPGHEASARLLEDRGHVLDAQPAAMIRNLEGLERPAAGALADWTADGDYAVVGPLNDRAYGLDTDSFTRALTRRPGESTYVYVVHDGDDAVACLLVTDHDGNSDVECVAVLPEARGRGISRYLLQHALVDAAERGNETSTLVSTALGYPVYERLGYRPVGRLAMWERAAAP